MTYYKPWLLFWICAVLSHFYMDYSFWKKLKALRRGKPLPDGGRWSFGSVRILLMEVLLQRQLLAVSFARWAIHMLVFWGFVGLAALSIFAFAVSLATMADADRGLGAFFFHGSGHAILKIWGDTFGLCLLLGLVAAATRRLVLRPRQLVNEQTDMVLLGYLLWLTVSGFVLEGLRLGQAPAGLAGYSFIGRLFAPHTAVAESWLTAAWTVHALSGIGLLLYLPQSKLMHSLLGPVVIALNTAAEQDRKDIYWPGIKNHRPTE